MNKSNDHIYIGGGGELVTKEANSIGTGRICRGRVCKGAKPLSFVAVICLFIIPGNFNVVACSL